jgi:hypothetical protein
MVEIEQSQSSVSPRTEAAEQFKKKFKKEVQKEVPVVAVEKTRKKGTIP